VGDDEVPGWWGRLGLTGLVDVHVHFLPDPVMDAVWHYFDQAERHYGVAWPIHYRTPVEDRLATLRALGVRSFPALVYPHKADMAAWLSEWARAFAARTPGCVPSGTFYPEPGVAAYVDAALAAGTRIFKVHLQVGGTTRGPTSWTRSGAGWPRPGCRWSSTAAPDRSRDGTPGRGRSARCCDGTRR
jgi:uncharacterized protein